MRKLIIFFVALTAMRQKIIFATNVNSVSNSRRTRLKCLIINFNRYYDFKFNLCLTIKLFLQNSVI